MRTSVLFYQFITFSIIFLSLRQIPSAGFFCRPYSISYKIPGPTVRTTAVRGEGRILYYRSGETG